MLETKLAQQLTYLEQEPLYETYIDHKKAYNAMDHEKCLEILRKYGVGTSMLRLTKFFWDNADLVCHPGGVFGEPF